MKYSNGKELEVEDYFKNKEKENEGVNPVGPILEDLPLLKPYFND